MLIAKKKRITSVR